MSNSRRSANLISEDNIFSDTTNNRVGIGTTIPVGQLQVSRGPIIVGTSSSTGTASQTLQVTGGVYVSGNLGIGTTNPTVKLHVIGDTIFTGMMTCTDVNSTSDFNLKDNIKTFENALNIIKDIRGVRFEWKESQRPSVGVVAQEVEKVIPELVTNSDPKTVNYNGLIGVLIEAVKEQQEQIDNLKEEIENIKSKLNI